MDYSQKIPRSIIKAFLWLLVTALLLAFAPWLSEMEFRYKAMILMGMLFAMIKLIGREYDVKEATFGQSDKNE